MTIRSLFPGTTVQPGLADRRGVRSPVSRADTFGVDPSYQAPRLWPPFTTLCPELDVQAPVRQSLPFGYLPQRCRVGNDDLTASGGNDAFSPQLIKLGRERAAREACRVSEFCLA